MGNNLSVVIPVLNEEKAIGKVIDEINGVLSQQHGLEYEIIVVDDGSTDKTTEIIGQKNIRIIKHDYTRGYGYSLKSGIKNANYEDIVVIDGDGTYSAKDIPKLLNYINDFDMIVGSRSRKRFSPFSLRLAVKWFLRRLAIYLSETNISDLNSGLRLIKKTIVNNFFTILPSGFSFTTTITLAMATRDYKIKYVPIEYHSRKHAKSKFHPIKDTFNMIILILQIIVYYNPLKIFVPLSIFLLISGIVVFIVSIVTTGKIMDTTVALLLLSALQMLTLGLITNLINKRKEI
ncbi:MAG TPA: glycosyltransferase family 2 protein [Candidatus Omnitrophica bacterium]|nr:glycosyltransferase family 2 protein [Candidatus Omnitrophota bacterium]